MHKRYACQSGTPEGEWTDGMETVPNTKACRTDPDGLLYEAGDFDVELRVTEGADRLWDINPDDVRF